MQIINSNGRAKIKLTNMRNSQGRRIGKPETRNQIAQEVKIARRLLITSEKIGTIVCQRIATPRAHVKETHLLSGNERTKSGKRIALSKVAPNPVAGMVKTASRANGYFPSRLVTRRDIELSYHDREDIKGTVRTILALAMEPDNYLVVSGERLEIPHWRNGEKLPKSVWKIIFKAARATLGMHKVMSREESYDAPEMQQGLPVVVELAADMLQESMEDTARLSRIAALGEHFRECIRATYEVDKSRKRLAAFKGMMAFCYLAEGVAMGKAGHGMTSIENACDWRKRFVAYVTKGEELLRMKPATLKDEIETAWAMHAIE